MTEAEWLSCTDPERMLAFLHGKVSDRKLRLFACACCRRVWALLTDERSQDAVVRSEQFADQQVTEEDLHAAMEAAYAAISQSDSHQVYYAKFSVLMDQGDRDSVGWQDTPGQYSVKARAFDNPCPVHFDSTAAAEEEAAQACLLRCIFGHLLFHLVTIHSAWLTWNNSTVPNLARSIYDDRRFSDMPILADALMDAGCDNQDLLRHCREPGEHVRGCWVLDLVLGRE